MGIVLAATLGVSLWLAIPGASRHHAAPGPLQPPGNRGPDPLPPPDPAKISDPYPDLGIRLDNYPRVDGSTSTQPLQMIVACRLFGMPTEWVHRESNDTRLLFPGLFPGLDPMSEKEFKQRYRLGQRVAKLVEPHGTSEAYVNLIEGRADLALVARSPSDHERALAGRRRVGLDARPVAYDAFVFLLSAKNPVSGLTIEQIRDIYTGRIANWREVGGPDAPIQPYQRTRNSGSQELMQTLVMKGRAMLAAPDLLTGALMSWPFLALDKDVHGIGYSLTFRVSDVQ
jgi:phosphate transport system substrate-binding protein